jgi:hypothetical protein
MHEGGADGAALVRLASFSVSPGTQRARLDSWRVM